MSKKLLFIFLLILTNIATSIANEKFATPKLRIPLMRTNPVIDGNISDAEWRDASRMERFCSSSPDVFPAESSFWVGSDGKILYIAIRSEVGPNGLLQRAQPVNKGNALPYMDDSVELTIVPDANNSEMNFYDIILNNIGALFSRTKKGKGDFIDWHPKGLKAIGSVKNGSWDFEIGIPLEDIGIKDGKLPKTMGLRVCRIWKRLALKKEVKTSWMPLSTKSLEKNITPIITWDQAAPVVKVQQLKDSKNSNSVCIKLTIYNPGSVSVKVDAQIKVKPENSADVTERKIMDVPSGKEVLVILKTSSFEKNEFLSTFIKVTSIDGKKEYYSRDYRWKVVCPENIFETPGSLKEKISAKFAYYPSYNKIRLNVNINALKKKNIVKDITVTLRDFKGQKLASYLMPPFKDGVSDVIENIPDLKKVSLTNGDKNEYTLTYDIKGIKDGKFIRKFVRNVMPWEGNKLGKSDLIVPPFTPINVKDMTLETILRKYKLNKLGLWKQVNADGQNLFKDEGMRLEAVVDGSEVPINISTFKFTKKTSTCVKTLSEWSAGKLKGTSETIWDYDGMMKWYLTLDPDVKVDSLKLIIPLDDSMMSLMHACADGVRINYGGIIPKGTGVVWKSSECTRRSIKGSYEPYIWVGKERRGFCTFGENDKGWVTSDKISCQELVRENDTLQLVLNLIAKPVELKEQRKILIGFQATPVKPMQKKWRLKNAWSYIGNAKITQFIDKIEFFGSCWYWGAASTYKDVYPRNKEMLFWNKLTETRKTGKIDKSFIKKWMEGFRSRFPKGSELHKQQEKSYKNHINAGFRIARKAGTKHDWKTMFYLNPQGMRFDTPEGQTFIDEWFRMPYANRKAYYLSGSNYGLNPVESYRDYAVWYYKKMLETGACDSLYWDDVFMHSDFNIVGTDAYRLPDGKIQPSSGIFEMRELIRRSAILQMELGKPVYNMVHLTNTTLVPICSFAQMNYDWEDHAGYNDFQDRYTKAYIRTMSIGRQTGNLPVIHGTIRGGNKEQREWCARTATGVMVTHELRWTKSFTEYWDALKLIYDFGYGQPDVEVFNYWIKDYPVKIEGIDSSSLVIKKKNSVLLIICDFGNGGEVSVIPDLKTLGLLNNFEAKNLETEKKLKVLNGKIIFALKKHDFIIIELK